MLNKVKTTTDAVNLGDLEFIEFDTNETVKICLDKAGIGIPYPQRDVHLYEHKVA